MEVIEANPLFSTEAGDDWYQAIRNETQSWHDYAKKYCLDRYQHYQQYLDTDFQKKFPRETASRLWELAIIDFLNQNKLALGVVPGARNQAKPDFVFSLEGQKFYVECTTASTGDPSVYPGLNQPLGEIEGKAVHPPEREYRERIASAFKTKAVDKFDSGYKNIITETDGFIVAISGAKIPFCHYSGRPELELSCFFSHSPYLSIPVEMNAGGGKLRPDKSYYKYEKSFSKKSNNAPIDAMYFLDENYSHISAVLISHCWYVFFPELDKHWLEQSIHWGQCRNDFMLVHNPLAKNPLPEKVLHVAREYVATIKNDSIQINNILVKD